MADTKLRPRDRAGNVWHKGRGGLPGIRTVDDIYIYWHRYRAFYTRCPLAKESDTLIALHGISSEVRKVLGDRLVFGIWIGHLISELLWYCDTANHSRGYISSSWRAPSWSWARWSCAISSGHQLDSSVSEYVHESVKVIRQPEKMKAQEEVELYAIVMRCWLISCKCGEPGALTTSRRNITLTSPSNLDLLAIAFYLDEISHCKIEE